MKNSLLTLPLFVLASACTVDTVVDNNEAEHIPDDTSRRQLQSYFADRGMPEESARGCAALGTLLEEQKAAYQEAHGIDASSLPPTLGGSSAQESLFEERAYLYQSECEQWQPPEGWAKCAVPDNPIVLVKSADCGVQAVNYLHCLADESLESLEECASQRWDRSCDTVSAQRDLRAEMMCESGHVGQDGDENFFLYHFGLSDCADSHSYAFSCQAPNDACDLSCSCKVDGVSSGTVSLPNLTIDSSFLETVWNECGFPELPETPD